MENLVIHSKIHKDNKTSKKKLRGESTIMGEYLVKDVTPNSKKYEAFQIEKRQNKMKFRGNSYNCGKVLATRLQIGSQRRIKIKSGMHSRNNLWDLKSMWYAQWMKFGWNSKRVAVWSGAIGHICVVKETFTSYTYA